MKKAASLSLLFLCLIFICAGCNTTESSVSGTVKIIGPDNTEIISTQVSVKGSEPTAEQAVLEACKEKKLAYTLQNHLFDNFDSIASTQTDGWILFANSDIFLPLCNSSFIFLFRLEIQYLLFSVNLL